MAKADTYPVMNGIIQGVESKERWFPGDPLPWTTQICHGITCNIVIDYKRCLKIPEFETKPDDVFIVTYPKSGTTWMQQIVKCIRTKGHPETVDEHLEDIFPWFEAMPQKDMEDRPSPRIYKSHSPYYMAAKGKSEATRCKYIHVIRHPKDVCVSLFHHMKGFWDYEFNGEFPEFVDLFLGGKVESGCWFDFVRTWYECAASKDERVLYVRYEDMKQKPREVIQQVADFLELPIDEAIIDLTIEKSSFAKMQKDNHANMSWRKEEFRANAEPFMRKGTVGDWKNHFSDEEQNKHFNEIFTEKLAGTKVESLYDLN
ncbi:amine sulfotransferase-like [Sycon ciliatum]|uniref:amine sulfotransferase-like n=1 Tax=Sycon ciliatum TaxID=27933 RepID=UPI0020AD6AAD|eukprot:scpid82320/ scgid16759/ Amine sulfotransferase; AST-RB1; Sulfotransferase 3A1